VLFLYRQVWEQGEEVKKKLLVDIYTTKWIGMKVMGDLPKLGPRELVTDAERDRSSFL
jgi:hypothetical protein